jgi:peptidoglycan/LPS O-acetylase OafA/YrhL
LLIGAALAFIYHRHPDFFTRWRSEWFLAGAIGLFVLITHYPGMRLSGHTIWQLSADALGCGLLIVAAMNPGWIGRLLICRPLPFLGKISFGLYVYHEIILHYSPRYFPLLQTEHSPRIWLAGFIVTFGLTIAISTVSYLFFERHFLKLKRRFEIVHARPA